MKTWHFFALVLLSATLSSWGYLAGKQRCNREWEIKWALRDTNEAKTAAHIQAQLRALEGRRQEAVRATEQHAQAQIDAAHADAVVAQSAAERLQQSLRVTRQQLAERETRRLSALTAERQAADPTAILLTELLSRADQRAGELAAYADRARITGQTCTDIYNRITRH